MIGRILAMFLVPCVVSSVLTLLVRAVAPRVGLTDDPDGARKLHSRPMPLGGGVAVFLATAATMAALVLIPNTWQQTLLNSSRQLMAMLAAGAIVVVVGVADDRFGLRGRHKLIGQCLAVGVLLAGGFGIQRVGIFGCEIELGLLGIPFTFFWLLGAINAINLLDGMDGLATSLGIVLAGTFAAMAMIVGHPETAIVALVFAGGLLGFAWFNFPPASIFLGDAGSMLIGLVSGALAILGTLKGTGTLLLAAPLAVLTIPIFDSSAAILRRKLTGRSIYTTDRGHFHHRLLHRLGSSRRVLAVVLGCCLLTSAGAVGSTLANNDLLALAAAVALVLILVLTGIFGRGELYLVLARGRQLGRSLLVFYGRNHAVQNCVHLQGSAHWQELWTMLMESAEDLGADRISLDVNLPLLHEGFNANWERPFVDEAVPAWQVEMPLMVANQAVGRFAITSEMDVATRREDVQRLLDLFDTCEFYLRGIVAQAETAVARDKSPSAAAVEEPVSQA